MKTTAVFDTEVYENYFLIAFMNVVTGRVTSFEMYAGKPFTNEELDTLRKIFKSVRLVGFNSINFDLPIISYALAGANNSQIKEMCDAIIATNLRPWQLEDKFKFKIIKSVDHIDLIEVAPGVASLKIYAGRMHAPKMQDLPIAPETLIADHERPTLREYCANDLAATRMLFEKLTAQIELREKMGEQYGQDLRSKSDAQIAEAVIKSQVEALTGEQLRRAELDHTFEAKYIAPDFLMRGTPIVGPIIDSIEAMSFYINDAGKIIEPDAFKNMTVAIGGSVYRMGIGGLHSSEKKISHYADEDTILVDRDVASYYPAIILRSGLAPENMKDQFQSVYKRIVDQRLAAKHSGDKVAADTLKITINGSFGKFGSKWSVLYGPRLLIQTTITGQLALLQLIEMLETAAIPVVSANTDGIVIKCPAERVGQMDNTIGAWELLTDFETEATYYASIHSRDVNNYCAIKRDGGFKAKGVYAPAGLQKNPTAEICIGAVIKFLADGTPVATTIENCEDIAKFVSIRTVRGGALDQGGEYLGKAVRWYYSTEVSDPITYKINGYKVPTSDAARAAMELPLSVPNDLDRDWYTNKSLAMLKEMGVEYA